MAWFASTCSTAAAEPIFELGNIQELGRHGYKLGPGTIYPLLHGMERRDWFGAELQLVNGHKRKVYTATATGRKALAQARNYVRELFVEMCEAEYQDFSPAPHRAEPIGRDKKRKVARI